MTSIAAVSAGRILVVDDEPDLRTVYELALLREGYEVCVAGDLSEARALLGQRGFDLLMTDMRLPDGLGLELVQEACASRKPMSSLVITAYGSADNAVRALKAGAFDYLTKPVDLQQLRAVVRAAVRSAGGMAVGQALPPSSGVSVADAARHGAARALDRLVGESELMCSVRAKVKKVAVTMAPVLLHGESGTGKELVARAVHDCSHRAAGPFVAVNCGAIPESLLEAEFFGVKKGAYTGAVQDRDGFFQVATGGTLFLDEIGDLPLSMQSKLLRAIQERCVRPVGSTLETLVDVRVVSATHKHLVQEVAAGRFRQDLFYRLNVIELVLPALRERKQDLDVLCDVLLERIAAGAPFPRLSAGARQWLHAHDFPGNVRELENILHRAFALSEGQELTLEQASPVALPGALPPNLEAHLDEHERRILLQALQECGYNRSAAAQRLGITLRKMRYRMERLHIAVPQGQDDAPESQPS
jgi:two-component system, NtrC family, response regulator PilR